jgi:hypothetical protein
VSASRSRYVVCSPWDEKPFDLDIVTGQDKPDGYFLNYWGAAIQIGDWGDLGAEVKALLDDPERLKDLHRRSLAWWDEELSECAVAEVIASCLDAPSGRENDYSWRPK